MGPEKKEADIRQLQAEQRRRNAEADWRIRSKNADRRAPGESGQDDVPPPARNRAEPEDGDGRRVRPIPRFSASRESEPLPRAPADADVRMDL